MENKSWQELFHLKMFSFSYKIEVERKKLIEEEGKRKKLGKVIKMELPFQNPESWTEIAYNYEALQKQIRERQEKLAKRFPLERLKVANEIKPLIKELVKIEMDLEKIKRQYFIDENNKIKELSKPGRVFRMMTISSHLNVVIGELKHLLENLQI